MAKRKHSADWMLARVREYLSGKGSYRQIARANGISERSLRDWGRKYEEQGEASFIERAGNASYSKEFKASCVLAALRGEGSVDNIVVKYNISSHSVLRHWMKQCRRTERPEMLYLATMSSTLPSPRSTARTQLALNSLL